MEDSTIFDLLLQTSWSCHTMIESFQVTSSRLGGKASKSNTNASEDVQQDQHVLKYEIAH
jgi:hypothetical protein